ncbi:chromobox protein homolog 5 isoform X3 [Monomorium pharaonis]|uniref:chromobox protein homolog 5 isoform X3 n=1 Tax=Monomorium pharaonis TaxID=307658 RepID=UPI00063F9D69|nr:chromobox protein homolog 5 isoform X3 [Monomorium pharaonis]
MGNKQRLHGRRRLSRKKSFVLRRKLLKLMNESNKTDTTNGTDNGSQFWRSNYHTLNVVNGSVNSALDSSIPIVKTEIDSCEDIETNEHLYADCADHLNEMNSRKQTIQADDRPLGFRRGLEADKILGSADDNGELMYLIQWKGTDAVDMVSAKEANAKCPQIVIQFYEDRITWSKAKIKV